MREFAIALVSFAVAASLVGAAPAVAEQLDFADLERVEHSAWCDACGEMWEQSLTSPLECDECGIHGPVCPACLVWHGLEAHRE